ncbi:Flagellar hook-length control protein-like protein [Desulfovibrio sp. X2]|uniref:flagellar hook-length control protein FliK n=1 Tax=Desulfovibrio sp. X2 TaxID=941449 RepID=UPI0003587477|nr:flagellar hook-length control protein FliK [Desulfovibrio sp. X2]EPR43888.1 Flagellar hook-length control protein-like protein [Desulfovibrio sp. X2]
MQFIPVTDTSKADTFFGMGSANAQKTASSFASILSNNTKSAREGFRQLISQASGKTEETASAAQDAAQQTAKGTEGATNAKAFSRIKNTDADPQSIKVTTVDFAGIKAGLQKYGLSKSEIKDLEDRVTSKGGLTWGQLVSYLMTKSSELAQAQAATQLSTAQVQDIDTFFQQVGFTPDESGDMIKDLKKGKAMDVLSMVQRKIDSLPKGQPLDVSPDGLKALAQAMGGTPQLQKQITQLLSDANGQRESFDSSEIKNALAMLQQQGAQKLKDMQQAAQELQQQIADTMAQAKDRMTGSGGDTDRAKVIQASNIAGEADRLLGKDAATAADAPNSQDAKDLKHFLDAQNAQSGKDAKDAGAGKADALLAQAKAAQDKNSSGQDDAFAKQGRDGKSGKDDPFGWKSFWERVENRGSEMGQAMGHTAATTTSTTQQPLANVPQAGTQAARYTTDSQQVFDQVQKGMMKTLQNGGRQLTLQLEPEELGQVHVTLQVQGKEVRALIRTEHQDVTAALHEQLSQVRDTLQQQGLKVTQLEVRTGLSDASMNGQQWNGTEQHNSEQERQYLADLRTRMRNLQGVTGVADMTGNDAADMQRMMAQRGLHLVA